MDRELDFLDHIRRESRRFADCLKDADPRAAVPSCPDWDASDLLWHLAEVQLFWAVIVRDRLSSPEASEAAKPERPSDYSESLGLFDDANTQLTAALDGAPDDTAVWTWSDDHTAGFVRRRQAHEALIHRLDAEQTVGQVTGIDSALGCDGVDEALRVMFGGLPAWATFTPDGATGRVRAADCDATWAVAFGRVTGTSPANGTTYDEDGLAVIDAEATVAGAGTVQGDAGDLDAWLWGRVPAAALTVDGDRAAFERLQAVISEGIQ